MRTLLLIIDPQNDFVNPCGSLFIPGATDAIRNIIYYISAHRDEISGIAVTMDTHHAFHIANPGFWSPLPDPFAKITVDDVKSGKYVPLKEEYIETTKTYLESIGGAVTIWPEHCLEGSNGWSMPDQLVLAINDWELDSNPVEFAEFYQKGLNPSFEAFSLFTEAPGHPGYRPYADIDVFADYDKIVICGFAKDVCVANTVMDMLRDGEKYYKDKLVFFEPGMASIDPNSPMNQVFADAVEHLGAEILTKV